MVGFVLYGLWYLPLTGRSSTVLVTQNEVFDSTFMLVLIKFLHLITDHLLAQEQPTDDKSTEDGRGS